jgi:hypothetical protein
MFFPFFFSLLSWSLLMIILAEVGRGLVEKQRHHRNRALLCPPELRAIVERL